MYKDVINNEVNNFSRSDRIINDIRKIISDILIKGSIKDKELFDQVVNISDIEISKDLSLVKVFLSPSFTTENQVEALNRHVGIFRKEISKQLKIKKSPNIIFSLDSQFNAFDHIDSVLKDINH